MKLTRIIVATYKQKIQDAINKCKKSTNKYKKIVEESTVIDINDLEECYRLMKCQYKNKNIEDILDIQKSVLTLKGIHQEYSKIEILEILKTNKYCVLGLEPRSGKTYIVASTIEEMMKLNEKFTVVFITLAPSETIEQTLNIFKNHSNFNGINVQLINDKKIPSTISNKNIFVLSKQFLDHTTNIKLPWLQKLNIDLVCIDEIHYGGTSELSKKHITTYSNVNTKYIFMTATYNKIFKKFTEIKADCLITFNIRHKKLLKTISKKTSQEELLKITNQKTMKIVLNRYKNCYKNEEEFYKKYPMLKLMYLSIKAYPELFSDDRGFGWRALLNQNKSNKIFKNEESVKKFLNYLIGGDLSSCESLLSKIHDMKIENDERYFKEGNPLTVLLFLDCHLKNIPIKKLSKELKKFIINNHIRDDFLVVDINSTTKNAVEYVREQEEIAKSMGKKGVLVLVGKKLSLGVTLPICDIVFLMNSTSSYDDYWQMISRCMTPSENNDKSYGYVVDLDMNRSIKMQFNIAMNVYPSELIKSSYKKIATKLIDLTEIGKKLKLTNISGSKLNELTNINYIQYTSDSNGMIKNLLTGINLNISDDLNDELKTIIGLYKKNNTIQKADIIEITDNDKITNDGVIVSDDDEEKESEESITNKEETIEYINYVKDILLPQLIPMCNILCINTSEYNLTKMLKYIQTQVKLLNIFKLQWNISFKTKFDNKYINFIIKIMDEINSIRFDEKLKIIKQHFIESKNDMKKLSSLIDQHLIPTNNEKKKNAEVSTPMDLRKQMLDMIPADFWKTPKKVFEPCSGKGGFLVDIYNRFDEGLSELYKDKNKRRKVILEECIYFADINPLNIYINRLLLDPNNEYQLNYFEGNTLELDIDGFDAVIGNPPYQLKVGPRKTKAIWDKFTLNSIKQLNTDGYLIFVHPSGWRSPGGIFNKVLRKIQEYNLIYLNMNDFKKGKEVFNVGTNFDYYLLQKNNKYTNTTIVDIYDNIYKFKINNHDFIPSGGFELYEKIIAKKDEEKVEVFYSRSLYGTDKSNMKREKTQEYKYPCVYTITQRYGIKKYYSSEKKGHFDIPKLIWSNGSGTYPVLDKEGQYGLTQFSYAIVDTIDNLKNIQKAMEKKKFLDLMNFVRFADHKYNYKIISLLRKDFWKQFI